MDKDELVRRIVKLFKERELLKIGNRSYVNAFKYPETRFDVKELMLDGGQDPAYIYRILEILTIVPPSSLIFKWGDGLVYDKKWWGGVYGGLTDAGTVINNAFAVLPSGRTWKERVMLRDNLTASTLLIPSYTTLDVLGKLFLADGVNSNLLMNSDVVAGNRDIEIIGGHFYGNRANQTLGSCLSFERVTNLRLERMFVENAYDFNVECGGCSNLTLADLHLEDSGQFNLYVHEYGGTVPTKVRAYNIYGKGSDKRNVAGGESGLLFADVQDLELGLIYAEESGLVGCGAGGGIDLYNCLDVSGGILIAYNNRFEGVELNLVKYGSFSAIVARENAADGLGVTSTSYGLSIGELTALLNGAAGAMLDGTRIKILGGLALNNSKATGNTRDGIELRANSRNCMVKKVEAIDDQATKTQRYGIAEYTGADYNRIMDNDVTPNATGTIVRIGANTLIKRNRGYVTEKVLAGVSVGATSTTIAHGLNEIPNRIHVTPQANAVVWRSAAPDATNIYLQASVAVTCDIYVAKE